MTLEDIRKLCAEFSASVGDTFDIPVSINARLTRALGRVIAIKRNNIWTPDRMEIARYTITDCTEKTAKDVIAHEWAHYYATKISRANHGHDAYFRSVCAMIGCTNDEPSMEIERVVEEKFKYDVYCPTCGRVIDHYKRMCDSVRNIHHYTCNACGCDGLYIIQNW